MVNQRKAYFFAGLSILAWSTAASAFKLALRQLDFIQMLFWAALASTIVLLIIIAIRGDVGKLFRQTKKDAANSALMGLCNPFIYYLILFKAYELLPAQEAQTLNWTWPIVLTIFNAIFFKHALTKREFVAIFISFIGVAIISLKGDVTALSFSNPFGTFLALLSSVFWASYWILNLKDKRDPVIMLATNFVWGTVFIGLVVAFFGTFQIPPIKGLSLAVYIGLFEMGLTFVAWLKALSLAKNRVIIANLGYLSPFMSLIFIYFIIGEAILPSTIVGLMLIIGGIILQTVGQTR